ncbi:MAG: class I SAM-dependent methyltransferase, partial [Planctomycetota bacterium]
LVHALPKRREDRAVFAHGDALSLPLSSDCADACTVAFGLRNTADRIVGLREMARVVRPGGWVLVLEFTTPPGKIFGSLYTSYFTKLLPRVGKLISKDDAAYRYLPDTVLAWPKAPALRDEMASIGLLDCDFRYLTRGIASLHWGRVPAAQESER